MPTLGTKTGDKVIADALSLRRTVEIALPR